MKADEEVAGIEANGVEHYRPFWGAGGKAYMFFGGGKKGHYGSDPAELAYNKALKEATDKRRASLAEAEELQRQMEELRKNRISAGSWPRGTRRFHGKRQAKEHPCRNGARGSP